MPCVSQELLRSLVTDLIISSGLSTPLLLLIELIVVCIIVSDQAFSHWRGFAGAASDRSSAGKIKVAPRG